jgi:ribosomal protein L29
MIGIELQINETSLIWKKLGFFLKKDLKHELITNLRNENRHYFSLRFNHKYDSINNNNHNTRAKKSIVSILL